MKLIPDQNRCCTAICLLELDDGIRPEYYNNEGLSFCGRWYYDEDEVDEDRTNYKNFELALALLRKNYVEYTSGLKDIWYTSSAWPHTIYDRGEEVDHFSTIFCFTATGDASTNQDLIEEFLEEFGFVGSEGRSSEKYKGDSIVRLWSISVSDFCKKCDEVMERIPSGYYGGVTIKSAEKSAA